LLRMARHSVLICETRNDPIPARQDRSFEHVFAAFDADLGNRQRPLDGRRRTCRFPRRHWRRWCPWHAGSDCHHGENPSGKRRPRCRRFSLRRYPPRPRAIYSTCSNPRMLFRSGSGGQRPFCGLKAFMPLARQRAETKRPSSKPFARRCAPPALIIGQRI
jgi:hypothetical protein